MARSTTGQARFPDQRNTGNWGRMGHVMVGQLAG